MTLKTLFLSVFFIFLGACGKAKDLSAPQTPLIEPITIAAPYELFESSDKTNFAELPLRGDIRNAAKFWSGDFWALQRGNINRRWNSNYHPAFNLRSPNRDEFLTMPKEKIAELAPSEKYDLLMGAYDYPLRNNVSVYAYEEADAWKGINHGWAIASVLHLEPAPKTLVNPDGIEIPFGSDDIKALLSFYYTFHFVAVPKEQVGKRCEKNIQFSNRDEACRDDVSAATFHLALANSIGIKKKVFLMDLDRYQDIWNHPVVAFEAEYRGNVKIMPHVTPGTASVIRVRSTVTYVDEARINNWDPILGTNHQVESVLVYHYLLHLDRDGNIIGGEWKSNERPDFLWTLNEETQFEGLLSGLVNLIRQEEYFE